MFVHQNARPPIAEAPDQGACCLANQSPAPSSDLANQPFEI